VKVSIIILTVLLVVSSQLVGCNSDKPQQESNTSDSIKMDAEQGLRDANERLYSGLNDMFEGNIDTLVDLWSHSDEVTQMGPWGERLTGWEAGASSYRHL
jgi:hypothetical protein